MQTTQSMLNSCLPSTLPVNMPIGELASYAMSFDNYVSNVIELQFLYGALEPIVSGTN